MGLILRNPSLPLLSPLSTQKDFLTHIRTTRKHHAQHKSTHLQNLLTTYPHICKIHTSAYHIFSMAKNNVLESLFILQTIDLMG